jgi:predicted nucleic acid-binding protein
MTLSYFDSSIILAMILDEERQSEAYGYWQNSIRVSSILLKIETIISLRRIYENNKGKLGTKWLNKKTKMLDEYLTEINYMILSSKIEQEIYKRKELSQCRALDAIHIATALQFREINNNEATNLYTFDKSMQRLAKHFEFKTNTLNQA